MRKFFLTIAALALFASCDYGLWDHPFNSPRSKVISSGEGVGHRIGAPVPGAKTDTAVYICGVRVPEGYDWQKDTALGIGRGEVFLLKDMKEVTAFSTGYAEYSGTDPDTHHLIDGHLYTEFSTSTHTMIKCDGKELVLYEGREFLSGLVARGGDVYTLGRRRSGRGFTYRKNGEIILDISEGTVFGSFQDPSYPRTGALYEDKGVICFAYFDEGTSCVHLVEDGEDRIMNGSMKTPVGSDVKICRGQLYAANVIGAGGLVYTSSGVSSVVASGYIWSSCSIFDTGSDICLVGNVAGGYNTRSAVYSATAGQVRVYEYEDFNIRCRDGIVTLVPAAYQGYHCFSRECQDFCGDDDYAVLSPTDGSPPVLRKNGEDAVIGINGYLTGVEVYVSPPN